MHALRRMKVSSRVLAIATVLGIIACFGAPPGRSQQESTQKPQQTIRTQTNLVNLFVSVRDKHNGIITNLTQDDFQVFEDDAPQKVAFFSQDVKMPITMGLLLDTSGSEMNMLPAIQDTASAFLQEVMHPGDEAMVMSFDTDADLLADFTDDKPLIENAIHRTRINAPQQPGSISTRLPVAGTVFYDAVYLAAHDQLAGQAGRKAILAVTDAQDEGSRIKITDAIEAAQRADAVVHILLVYDPRYGGNVGAAKKMTDETGGRVIEVRSAKNLQQAFDTISEELRHQYVVGYYPSNAARDGGYRKVRVTVKTPDAKVLTRKGYYAPKD